MGEHTRGEDWLSEGWKIEIRVRKSGKKDRDVPENIQSINSKEERKKKTRNEANEDKIKAEDSKETVKKPSSKSSKGSKTPRRKKKRESVPFFILDPDQCKDSSSLSIPNLTEIVDSMLREKEDSKNVYLSAPAIGSLLGQNLSKSRTTNNSLMKYKLGPYMSKDYGISSNMLPCMPSELVVKNEDWESRSLAVPYHLQPRAPTEGTRMMIVESKAEVSGCSDLGDLFDDPCIDFAIKTLTGDLSLGA